MQLVYLRATAAVLVVISQLAVAKRYPVSSSYGVMDEVDDVQDIAQVYNEIAVLQDESQSIYDFNAVVAHVIGKPGHTCKEMATYEMCSSFRKVDPGVSGRATDDWSVVDALCGATCKKLVERGRFGGACVNLFDGWKDAEGRGCAFYKDNSATFQTDLEATALLAKDGYDAHDVCCTFGGGRDGSVAVTTTTSTTTTTQEPAPTNYEEVFAENATETGSVCLNADGETPSTRRNHYGWNAPGKAWTLRTCADKCDASFADGYGMCHGFNMYNTFMCTVYFDPVPLANPNPCTSCSKRCFGRVVVPPPPPPPPAVTTSTTTSTTTTTESEITSTEEATTFLPESANDDDENNGVDNGNYDDDDTVGFCVDPTGRWQCPNSTTTIPCAYVCDEQADCEGGEDENYDFCLDKISNDDSISSGNGTTDDDGFNGDDDYMPGYPDDGYYGYDADDQNYTNKCICKEEWTFLNKPYYGCDLDKSSTSYIDAWCDTTEPCENSGGTAEKPWAFCKYFDETLIEAGEADNAFGIKALNNDALDRMLDVKITPPQYSPAEGDASIEQIAACGGTYCRPTQSVDVSKVEPGIVYNTDQTSGLTSVRWNCDRGEEFVFMLYDSMDGMNPDNVELGSIVSVEWGIECSMSSGGLAGIGAATFQKGIDAGAQPGHPYYGYYPPGNPSAVPNTYHWLVFLSNKTDFDVNEPSLEGGSDGISTNITKYLGDNGLDTLVARAYARIIGGYFSANLMQLPAMRQRFGDSKAAGFAATACETIGLTFPGFEAVDAAEDAKNGQAEECTPTDCDSKTHDTCVSQCTECAQVKACFERDEECPHALCYECFDRKAPPPTPAPECECKGTWDWMNVTYSGCQFTPDDAFGAWCYTVAECKAPGKASNWAYCNEDSGFALYAPDTNSAYDDDIFDFTSGSGGYRGGSLDQDNSLLCKSYLNCPGHESDWEMGVPGGSGSSGISSGGSSGSSSGSEWLNYSSGSSSGSGDVSDDDFPLNEYVGNAVDHDSVAADLFFNSETPDAPPLTCGEISLYCQYYEFIRYVCPVTCGANQYVASNYTNDQNQILFNQYKATCANVESSAMCNAQPAVLVACPQTCARLARQEAADLESKTSGSGSGESGDDDDEPEWSESGSGSGDGGRQRRDSNGSISTSHTVATTSSLLDRTLSHVNSQGRHRRGGSSNQRVRACKDNNRAVNVLWGKAGAGQKINCASTRQLFGCLDPGFATLCPETCLQCIDGVPEAMYKMVGLEESVSIDWLSVSERNTLILQQEKLEAMQACNAKVAASNYECTSAAEYCPSPYV